MASSNLKLFHIFGILSVLLLIQTSNAFEFKVGGPTNSWTVPSDPNAAIYNQWAEKSRFEIGDTLLFVYDGNKDLVLHVTKDDYTNCNTATPLEKFSDGHTSFLLHESGPYYFISGVAENCRKNEKLVVVVMADRSNKQKSSPSPPPSSSAEEPLAPSEDSSPPNNGAFSTTAAALTALLGFSVVLVI